MATGGLSSGPNRIKGNPGIVAAMSTDKPSDPLAELKSVARELGIHGAQESREQGWPEGYGGKGRFEFWQDTVNAAIAALEAERARTKKVAAWMRDHRRRMLPGFTIIDKWADELDPAE